jgi:hypothetical protein
MYNYLILSSSLLGSFYVFSQSLQLINMSLLEDEKIPYNLIVVNVTALVFSGYIITNSLTYETNKKRK